MDILSTLLDFDPAKELPDNFTTRTQTRPTRLAQLIEPIPLKPAKQPKRRSADPHDHLPASVVKNKKWTAAPPREKISARKITAPSKIRRESKGKQLKIKKPVTLFPMASPIERPAEPCTPPRSQTPPLIDGSHFIPCRGSERFSPDRIPNFIPFSSPTVFYYDNTGNNKVDQRKRRYQVYKSKAKFGEKPTGTQLRNRKRSARHHRRLFD